MTVMVQFNVGRVSGTLMIIAHKVSFVYCSMKYSYIDYMMTTACDSSPCANDEYTENGIIDDVNEW